MLLALFLSTHPMPSLAVTTFSVLYGISIGLTPFQLAVVGLSVLSQQFSVGLSNDWLDRARDRQVARTDKPVALGQISEKLVRNSAFLFVLLALLLGLSIGVMSGLVMLVMLAAGWSYNLGLKAGIFSVVPYLVGFGILPSFITLAASEPYLPEPWVFLVTALLGLSAHFANALPDILDDQQTGINALPHVLGQRASGFVIALAAVAASAIVVWQSDELPWVLGLIGMALTLALAALATVLALKRPPPRLLFPVLVAVSFVNVTLFMLA